MKSIKEVADENDYLWRTFIGGKVLLTSGVAASPIKDQILKSVREFDDFHKGNDPYGEHDFAAINVNGEKYLFKIDYYDTNYEFGVDPREEKCNRVLTIMCANEY